MKEKIKDILWLIKAYISQPIVPTVSVQYILDKDCSYTSNNYLEDKYVYYWEGDFKTGKQVKVKSIDLLRYRYKELELKSNINARKIIDAVKQVETHDLGENFVKNEIVNILEQMIE